MLITIKMSSANPRGRTHDAYKIAEVIPTSCCATEKLVQKHFHEDNSSHVSYEIVIDTYTKKQTQIIVFL